MKLSCCLPTQTCRDFADHVEGRKPFRSMAHVSGQSGTENGPKTWSSDRKVLLLSRKKTSGTFSPREGIKTILTTEFKGKPAKPEDFVDSSFIKALDDSGYIDGLYKRR